MRAAGPPPSELPAAATGDGRTVTRRLADAVDAAVATHRNLLTVGPGRTLTTVRRDFVVHVAQDLVQAVRALCPPELARQLAELEADALLARADDASPGA